MDGVHVGGCTRSKLAKAVNLETGESISNGVVCTCNVGYKDMYVIILLCCTKIKHANKSHYFGAVGSTFFPDVYHCPVVEMDQELFSWPLVAPGIYSLLRLWQTAPSKQCPCQLGQVTSELESNDLTSMPPSQGCWMHQ